MAWLCEQIQTSLWFYYITYSICVTSEKDLMSLGVGAIEMRVTNELLQSSTESETFFL